MPKRIYFAKWVGFSCSRILTCSEWGKKYESIKSSLSLSVVPVLLNENFLEQAPLVLFIFDHKFGWL